MTRIRNIPPKSFADQKYFPGTTGNPFDWLLHFTEDLQKIQTYPFMLILLALAFLGGGFHPIHTLVLFGFFLCDWILLGLLPKMKLSYGPVKPAVLFLAVLRTLFAFLPFWVSFGFQVAGVLLVIYGFFIEPFRLDVHHEVFYSQKLPADTHLRIAHLGDLHIERLTKREAQILAILKQNAPDFILFSGDILSLSYLHDDQAQADSRQFLSSLSAPLGVFGVSGSPAVDLPELFPLLIKETPLHWLNNQSVTVPVGTGQVTVTGLTCSHQPERDFATLSTIPQDKKSGLNILLYHTPDIAPLIGNSAYDLQLSGHTHGGQVCLPLFGALFSGSLYKKAFEAGRYLVGNLTLYVTRGIGMEGASAPRVRFLCPPEIVFWEICGKTDQSL